MWRLTIYDRDQEPNWPVVNRMEYPTLTEAIQGLYRYCGDDDSFIIEWSITNPEGQIVARWRHEQLGGGRTGTE